MGKFLDQCENDAWEVIWGRKKIVGNRIFDCNEKEKSENKDFGWLAPNGSFYPVEFGEHQAWASQYLLNEYKKGNLEQKCKENPGDKMCEIGFILIHKPYGYFSISRSYEKRITKKQKEFLVSYFEKRNMDQWLEKLYQEEL